MPSSFTDDSTVLLNPASNLVPFTEFRRPNGERVQQHLEVPADVYVLAKELIEAGWRFESENLIGMVHVDCCDEDTQLANDLISDPATSTERACKMIQRAHAHWTSIGKPRAKGASVDFLDDIGEGASFKVGNMGAFREACLRAADGEDLDLTGCDVPKDES